MLRQVVKTILNDLRTSRSRDAVPSHAARPEHVKQPLVLITQIQRSGGTLLSQLFDGHPSIYAHPHELHIGRPAKWDWPELKLDADPVSWFEALYEYRLEEFIGRGYVKAGSNRFAASEAHPFNLSRETQESVFLGCVQESPIQSQRDVLNCFFTSFFAAWADHQSSGKEKFITAFCPRVLMKADSTQRLIQDYPDGWIICSVRDPRSWYLSSSRHNSTLYANVEKAIEQWVFSTRAVMAMLEQRPDNTHVVTYELLISEPESVMRGLASRLGIPYDECLTMPTYLSRPILPNSSFDTQQYGINRNAMDRMNMLDEADSAYIAKHALPLYREAEAAARQYLSSGGDD